MKRTIQNSIALMGLSLVLAAGCAKNATVFPNSDPALNRKPKEFSADAANRHPFKADLPKAGPADGIARLDYTLETVELANLSTETWENVEVWVNGKYVVFVPKIEAGRLRTLNFKMFYDGRGNTIPKSVNDKPRIESVKILRNGAIYDVPSTIAV
jgi:hypothetical protein